MRLYEDINKQDYLPSLQKALLRKKSYNVSPRNDEVLSILKDRERACMEFTLKTELIFWKN